ncbi:MAG: glycosyltransferase [Proteobacteria bacterium]|nr:glycosyltransferase [Pseudomonadota bacterium]
MNKIAVLYLARVGDGLIHFKNFAQSYQRYNAGQNHDLIIIYKGEFTHGQKAAADHIFRNIPHQSFFVPDNIGFDIHAYLHVAEQIDHKYICVFNTYTQLLTENWLKNFYVHLKKPDVGIVGASGAYGSHLNGLKLIHHMNWLYFNEEVSFRDKKELKKYANTFLGVIPDFKYKQYMYYMNLYLKPLYWLALKIVSPIVRLLMLPFKKIKISDDFSPKFKKGLSATKTKFSTKPLMRYNHPSLRAKFEKHWEYLKNETEANYVKDFFPFPTPHIRTNAFMTRREILLEFQGLGKTKQDCYIFEGGKNSITNCVLKKGLSALVIGTDGVAYSPDEWPKSRNFWMEEQQNLMVSDNQVIHYASLSKEERQLHTYLIWGDYIGPAPKLILDLGYQLKKSVPLLRSFKPAKVSIVIPTHNRLHLLKDAIFSVIQQRNSNWELVIFDNASSDPIEEYVKSLKDERIKYKRSKTFLPVTDSWNKAMDVATGDYIIMLGDDDGLAPHYLEVINKYVLDFNEPDFIYSGRFYFVHPAAQSAYLDGYLDSSHYGFFFLTEQNPPTLQKAPYLLSARDAREAWSSSINCKRRFSFSMQCFTFKRSFLETIKRDGQLFQSLFPDYYLANIAMAYGKSMVIVPERLTIQGVSTKSYGYMMFNNLEQTGDDFLNIRAYKDPLFNKYKDVLLPGEAYQDKYIITMGHVAKNAPGNVNLKSGINRYRRHQIFYNLRKEDKISWLWSTKVGRELRKKLKTTELGWTLFMTLCYSFNKQNKNRVVERLIRNIAMHQNTDQIHYRISSGEFAVLPEIYDVLEKTGWS